MDRGVDVKMPTALPPAPDLTRWTPRTDHPFTSRPFRPKRILVVGLGTPTAFSVAFSYPEADVMGFDEDPAILFLTEAAVSDMRLTNLRLIAGDLDDPGSLPGSFDWIHCPDPLRPMGDEETAWRTLARHLDSVGLLTVRMRSRRQEYWGDEFREAVRIIAGNGVATDLSAWVAVGRRLARDLARGCSRLSPVGRAVETQLLHAPALAAALALLPAGRSHTLDSIRALLAQAGLTLLGFLNEPAWEVRGMHADPEIAALQAALSLEEQDELRDILHHPDYLVACGHPPSAATRAPKTAPARAARTQPSLLPGSDDAFADAVRRFRAGEVQQAGLLCRQILEGDPHHADALDLLGVNSHRMGDRALAVDCFRQAIALNPLKPTYHSNQGVICQDLGELDQAEACFREALRLDPDYAEAHNNLATVLQARGSLQVASAHCREALRIRPDLAEAHHNLGTIFLAQRQYGEALSHCREALRLRPNYAEAHNNLGTILQAQGQYGEALFHYREAIGLRPDYVEANLNYAQASLLTGDFARGWPGYEWRWKLGRTPPCPFHQPRWDGTPLEGRTILLHAEQGLGDTLQFVRYAPLVKRRGGTVIVRCQPSLRRLLGTCPGVDAALAEGEPMPPFDLHAPILSLPGIFGTTLDSVPAAVPYLSPLPDDPLGLDAALGPGRDALQIGIVWAGSPTHGNDRDRSCSLQCFCELAHRSDLTLFSLQKGPRTADLTEPASAMPVTDLGDRLHDFADTAAAITRLDLVITVDTAVAHLAGALGKPVWVLLPFAPDWRWLLEREDSPWYPTMRLFRQAQPGDWAGVFARVGAALQEHRAGSAIREGSA